MEEFHPFRKVQSPGFWTFSKQPMLLLDQAPQLVFLASTKAGVKPALKSHVHCKHTRQAIQTWFPSLFSLIKCPLIEFLGANFPLLPAVTVFLDASNVQK